MLWISIVWNLSMVELIVALLVKIDIRYIRFFFCIESCYEIIWSWSYAFMYRRQHTFKCLWPCFLLIIIKVVSLIGNNKNVTLNDWFEASKFFLLVFIKYFKLCNQCLPSCSFYIYIAILTNAFTLSKYCSLILCKS